MSVFNEERIREVEQQRKGLSLATLFAKPRPMWTAPAFVGVFGDAFIERTSFEASSNLAWSFTVLNFALQRMAKSQLLLSEASGLDYVARVSLSDSVHIMQQSAAVFKLMLRMLKTPSESQLLSFLKKLKKFIQGVSVGETILLPALVEGKELILLLERSSDRLFRVVVINTDANNGLKFHSSSPIEAMPLIQYRTCMVLKDVPKKNVYDDVFWMAVYNMAIYTHQGDTVKFYDVLIPFLTGKPLEASLVEAETSALTTTKPDVDDCDHGDAKLSRFSDFGSWRFPQRSSTAYVRCVLEALHYLLRRRGATDSQSNMVRKILHYVFEFPHLTQCWS